ncbi:unnamed protein product [Mytilus edulis]|uniref:Uncharacterized protein n=1 Tax=Mytilus edulis TaxID=6550 RepID=A0A8S3QJ48_MYTED|nr:unnamed protein product [Mytilus edulis]
MGVSVHNGLSGIEGFQTRISHRDNTRWSKCITVYLALKDFKLEQPEQHRWKHCGWSKCITVYLALKVFKLESVIETTPNGVFKLEAVIKTTPNGVLSGTEGFQTRSSHKDNTKWSKCITVYLALKVFKLEAVIEQHQMDLSGTEGFQTRSSHSDNTKWSKCITVYLALFQTRISHRDNTRWSKCITVYLALKVFKLESVIETTPDG